MRTARIAIHAAQICSSISGRLEKGHLDGRSLLSQDAKVGLRAHRREFQKDNHTMRRCPFLHGTSGRNSCGFCELRMKQFGPL